MTLHPDASVAQASSPRPPHPETVSASFSETLLLPESAVFDADAVQSEIGDALASAEPGHRRAAVVGVLARARKAGRAALADAFAREPHAARALVHAYAFLTDGLVEAALRAAAERLHPPGTTRPANALAVLAVGGYGRAEMAPHSDVDLLFLIPGKATAWIETVVEEVLYILWDLKLKVGHATRTVRECIRLGREDYTIRTSLLEMRHLSGNAALSRSLGKALWDELFRDTGRDYIEAKLAERSARHTKQGGQRYMLEPNVKEGKGGLRDLQSLFWIAKYVHRVHRVEDLVGLGVFRPEEYRAFAQAEDFLLAVRAHLHLISSRAMDQLTFDMQVEVAARMGYTDHSGRRAVEHFMQDYFRHATRVGELTRIFLTSLEASHAKREPMLVGLLRRRKKVREGYEVRQGRLALTDPKTFFVEPLNILRIFEEALRTGLLLHPDAMRQIRANLYRIDDRMRSDKTAARIFMDLMLKHGNPERALRRMNELGALAAFIPEFEPIVAMMQFNVYHAYTVDEHTIQVIRVLSDIERGVLREELPIASRILGGEINRRVLYSALLLHDIGKGRPEDHSILGAQIARAVCPRLHLKPEEAETVEWLVRNHLLMSDVAQKRDITDPRTVRDFAKAVKSRKRLDLLTVVTVCDIRGVSAKAWNNWKAQLLRSLYRQTVTALEGGMEALNRENRGSEARKALREDLSDWPQKCLREELSRHYPAYWEGMPSDAHATFAKLLRNLGNGDVHIELTPDEARDATRACFALVDHPGIFARLAGALAIVGANIVDARTYTTKDGFATAAFWLQDGDGHPYEADRLPRLRDTIQKTLKGEVVPSDALIRRDKLKRREQDFRFPTAIAFDNEGSDIYTIIEVDTRDRPGLLYDLTRTLADAHIYIATAVIATYGAQVVDTFYVKDMFGLKIHSAAKRATLEKRLRQAIAAGAERAHGG